MRSGRGEERALVLGSRVRGRRVKVWSILEEGEVKVEVVLAEVVLVELVEVGGRSGDVFLVFRRWTFD